MVTRVVMAHENHRCLEGTRKGIQLAGNWMADNSRQGAGKEVANFFVLNGSSSWMGVGCEIVRSVGQAEIGLSRDHTMRTVR